MAKLPKRSAKLAFEGEYAEMEVVVWLSAPVGLGDDIAPDDPRSNIKLLPRVILSWNVEDDAGPVPVEYEAMVARVGADFLGLVAKGYMDAVRAMAERDFPPPNGGASASTSTTSAVRPA